jgi:hypothetical protein
MFIKDNFTFVGVEPLLAHVYNSYIVNKKVQVRS